MRRAVLAVLLGGLAGCGGGEVGEAVELCRKAVNARLTDQAAEFDTSAMQKAATIADDGTITIREHIRFRTGTSDEGTQPFSCVVSTKNEKGEYDPRLIRMEIDPLGFKKTG